MAHASPFSGVKSYVCTADNTLRSDVCYDKALATAVLDELSSQPPGPQNIRIKSKFRVTSSFNNALIAPRQEYSAPSYIYLEGYQKPTRYPLVPFYYVFLFRFALF